jgi:aspartate carbamoyltransferase catalytic subunit
VDEISPDVDALPNARYFEQASNGVFVRAALIAEVLGLEL